MFLQLIIPDMGIFLCSIWNLKFSARKSTEKNHLLCFTDKITDKKTCLYFGTVFELTQTVELTQINSNYLSIHLNSRLFISIFVNNIPREAKGDTWNYIWWKFIELGWSDNYNTLLEINHTKLNSL